MNKREAFDFLNLYQAIRVANKAFMKEFQVEEDEECKIRRRFTDLKSQREAFRKKADLNTVEPAITATLYNGHQSIAVTNEQFRPKFHNIEPVYSGHLLNAASGHPFVVPY